MYRSSTGSAKVSNVGHQCEWLTNGQAIAACNLSCNHVISSRCRLTERLQHKVQTVLIVQQNPLAPAQVYPNTESGLIMSTVDIDVVRHRAEKATAKNLGGTEDKCEARSMTGRQP